MMDIGIVAIRFVVAVMFQWFFSWKLGNFMRETYEQLKTCLAISTTPPGAGTVPASAKMACEKRKIARYSSQYFYVHTLRGFLQRIGWTTKNSIWHALSLAQSQLEALNHVCVFTPSD